jgi:glucose-1-phosphate cytidylyltransferase
LKAVILWDGKKTRLREEPEFRPKPKVSIGGRPNFGHVIKICAAGSRSRDVIRQPPGFASS